MSWKSFEDFKMESSEFWFKSLTNFTLSSQNKKKKRKNKAGCLILLDFETLQSYTKQNNVVLA